MKKYIHSNGKNRRLDEEYWNEFGIESIAKPQKVAKKKISIIQKLKKFFKL